LKILPQ